jgi:proteasome lid subunit RPN8/RPN11
MSAVADGSLPEGQQEAVEALRSIARASDGALTVDLDYEQLAGVLTVRVYLSSASLLSSEQGIDLVDWEPIDIAIPENFPYMSPIASTGRDDFPELPHQARGSAFCVRVEDSEWDPTAGMQGFLRAVIDTYQHIALGTLQGHLQAWRPVTVRYLGQGWAVIRADLAATSSPGPGTSFGWAVGIEVNEDRIDIIEWLDIDDTRTAADLTEVLAGELARITATTSNAFLIPAVIISRPIAMEYFDSWIQLLVRLQEEGVDKERLLDHLARAATINQSQSEGQERAVILFRVAADTEPAAADTEPAPTGQDARFAVARLTQYDPRLLSDIRTALDEADSLNQAPEEFFEPRVPWVRVYDGRPESVLRRTASRPTEKLAGTRILLLGCGGLGAPIAEHCVRSGAVGVHIVDSGTVSPGILSRQPYEDADIGKLKAQVLADRLGRIRPENKITSSVDDIVYSDIFNESDLSQYNLIIDATANRSVAAKIERSRRDKRDQWPALITVAISQEATHGAAAVSSRGAVGAGIDLLRRLGLKTSMSTALGDIYAAFFPPQARRLNFRPDTSCSDTTFIGSTTDISALAAQLLDGALARLDPPDAIGTRPPYRSLSIVRLGSGDELKAARVVLDLPPDRVVMDHGQTYEVRVDETAMETIREFIRASVNGRTPGAGHTGGLLLGQFDSACRIAWVSQATGLPPDSTVDPLSIELNMDEVRDFLDNRASQSGGLLTLIGLWHTHPGGSTAPSETDRTTMRKLVDSPEWPSAPALLLILDVPDEGSTGDPTPWRPKIHAETFATWSGPDGGAASEGS